MLCGSWDLNSGFWLTTKLSFWPHLIYLLIHLSLWVLWTELRSSILPVEPSVWPCSTVSPICPSSVPPVDSDLVTVTMATT